MTPEEQLGIAIVVIPLLLLQIWFLTDLVRRTKWPNNKNGRLIWLMVWVFGLVFGYGMFLPIIYYFMVIRPAKSENKALPESFNSLAGENASYTATSHPKPLLDATAKIALVIILGVVLLPFILIVGRLLLR